jgi:hypothetical protein
MPAKRGASLAIAATVLVTLVAWATVSALLATRTDGNDVLLRSTKESYGYPRGAYVQVVVVDGWPIEHTIAPGAGGESREVGRQTLRGN